jgi:hypothetical protein
MESKIGKRFYRGLLKRVARAWSPEQIRETAVLEQVLVQMQGAVRGFKTLSADRMQVLRDQGKQFDDGRYELYKSTIKYDRDLGRSQHGYPSSAELPV